MKLLTQGNWAVVLVQPGDTYGRDGTLRAETAMVEFWDLRHPFDLVNSKASGTRGQFTGGRYNLDTLIGEPPRPRALALDMGVPSWTVSREDMAVIDAWLRAQVFGDTIKP